MIIKKYYISLFIAIIVFSLYSKTCISQDEFPITQETQYLDTIPVAEMSLDSIKFFMGGNSSRIDNNSKDTIFLPVGDKVYRIPIKVTTSALVNIQRKGKYFKLTGLLLSEDSLDFYVSELFRNPWKKLLDSMSADKWYKSDIYLQYFEPNDTNSPYKGKKKNNNSSVNEFDSFKSDEKSGSVIENYEGFPLPQSIDLEVDLTKTPGVLTLLGLDFNFDKLEKGFQELLIRYGYSSNKKYKNRRSNESKNDKN